jgi:two-component system NtrC family response regulator
MNNGACESCGILVVDDDLGLARTLGDFLRDEGYCVGIATSAEEALQVHDSGRYCIALVDLIIPPSDGLELMERLHARNRDLAVLVMTGYGTIDTAVDAVKRGAEDYITKPFERQAVRAKIARLMELFELRSRVAQLEVGLRTSCPPFESLVFVSASMQRVVETARHAAMSDAAVLLIGETGTGKEMLARAIHGASGRVHAPFVPVNWWRASCLASVAAPIPAPMPMRPACSLPPAAAPSSSTRSARCPRRRR